MVVEEIPKASFSRRADMRAVIDNDVKTIRGDFGGSPS
jgi:hypothetical protein